MKYFISLLPILITLHLVSSLYTQPSLEHIPLTSFNLPKNSWLAKGNNQEELGALKTYKGYIEHTKLFKAFLTDDRSIEKSLIIEHIFSNSKFVHSVEQAIYELLIALGVYQQAVNENKNVNISPFLVILIENSIIELLTNLIDNLRAAQSQILKTKLSISLAEWYDELINALVSIVARITTLNSLKNHRLSQPFDINIEDQDLIYLIPLMRNNTIPHILNDIIVSGIAYTKEVRQNPFKDISAVILQDACAVMKQVMQFCIYPLGRLIENMETYTNAHYRTSSKLFKGVYPFVNKTLLYLQSLKRLAYITQVNNIFNEESIKDGLNNIIKNGHFQFTDLIARSLFIIKKLSQHWQTTVQQNSIILNNKNDHPLPPGEQKTEELRKEQIKIGQLPRALGSRPFMDNLQGMKCIFKCYSRKIFMELAYNDEFFRILLLSYRYSSIQSYPENLLKEDLNYLKRFIRGLIKHYDDKKLHQ